ncbi:PREDICTED: acylamino-acid-releasing enzyme-like [Acropora digitifera]|uniref:acylamino-acid-releasing enzyme-like n=1 Tax=Acropora digitifera TaxID=70779 RepID=UPI00077B13EE|nr:PREDICTED: acylamino-acid-releasing enzyme-like [Acropora digitifera]
MLGKVAIINPGSNSGTAELNVTSLWSQRDLERNENRTFLRSHIGNYDTNSKSFSDIREPSFPVEVQNLLLCSVSPTGRLQAQLRNVPGRKGKEDKQFLEIWSRSHLLKSIDVQACEKHGKVYEDPQFGCLAWSASERFLLYVAEKKLPKSVSYFERQKPDVSSDKPAPQKGTQFDFKEDWGEQLISKCCPVLVIYDMTTDEIKVLEGVPENISAGQACWGPDDDSVVFVGWCHEPYRLGLIYCPIRPYIEITSWKARAYGIFTRVEQLSDSKHAVHSPRFNNTMDKLMYISVDVGGAHRKCGRVMLYDWKSKRTSTNVDVVDIPERGGFPGIYHPGRLFSQRHWTDDGSSVVMTTGWRSYQKIILINCNDKSVKVLTTAETAKFSLEKEMTWEVLSFSRSETSDVQDEYEAVFQKPVTTSGKKPKLIVTPHGGPHSNFNSNFSLYNACLCKLGFAVLAVNFRGSLGFGQKPLHSLPGKIGTQDVQDVQHAAKKVLENGEVDDTNVFVMGGSHGGFLTAHLIGQYPDFYKAAATRNPALNIAGMAEMSDIPDWCYFEGGFSFTHQSTPTPEVLAKLLQVSPYAHFSKFVCLFRRLLWYPGNNHPISKVDAESDVFVNLARWFFEHAQK